MAIIVLIDEARRDGARLEPACRVVGISGRTYQRWVKQGPSPVDGRTLAKRTPPANKLSEIERARVIKVCNSEVFVDSNPTQIVPKLADQGIYLASESTIYRILKEEKLNAKRVPTRKSASKPLQTHIAKGPNEVWSWDITWLPGPVKGIFFKLYLIMDIFSRFIAGWEVHKEELTEHAEKLVKKTRFKHGGLKDLLVLHSDNGSIMRAQTFQVLLENLRITKSYSRPRVSNDNAYSEALFKTLKYIRTFPTKGFATLEEARSWVQGFVYLYNCELLHSGIKFVTPYQRHYGLDIQILANRDDVYKRARQKHPERWTGNTRNWTRIDEVTLNPVSEKHGEKVMRQLP